MADAGVGVVEGVRVSIRSMVVAMAGALLLVVGALAPGLAPVAAAAGDPYETVTTYTVDPDHHEVDVAIDLVPTAARMALDEPSTDHLFHVAAEQLHAWIADSATGTAVTLAGAALPWSDEPAATGDPLGYHQISIAVPAYRARSIRHVQVAYAIPSADVRSGDPTRVLADYVHLCVRGNGPLDGRVVVEAPLVYELDPFDGPSQFEAGRGARTLALDSGSLGEPSAWGACFNLINPDEDHVATVVTGGGAVTLRSWPGDSAWQTRVTASIENAVPALVALIGRPIPRVAGLVIREAVVAPGYEGQYGSDQNTIVLSEGITSDSISGSSITVAHELAHAWFNRDTDGAAWISEGTAEWAARSVIGSADPCTVPATADSTTLATWKYLTATATPAERQAVWDQYDTACAVVTEVAAAAGRLGAKNAITALMDKRDPYGSSIPVVRTTVSWRDWLDAMDELGIYPNGGSDSLAGSLLLKYGVTSNDAELHERLVARRAYHQLMRRAAPWLVPTAIRDLLSGWSFKAAETAIATARDAYDAVAQADVLVPGSHASAGPIRVQWESARSQADLDAVLALAQAQRDAARDVADAMAPLQSALGFVPWVGSLGSTSTTLADAQAAVGADNPAAAEAAAIALRGEMLHYEALGQRRLSIAGIVAFNLAVVLGLVVAALVARRRARRQAAARASHGEAAISILEVVEVLPGGRRNPRLPPAPPGWSEAPSGTDAGRSAPATNRAEQRRPVGARPTEPPPPPPTT